MRYKRWSTKESQEVLRLFISRQAFPFSLEFTSQGSLVDTLRCHLKPLEKRLDINSTCKPSNEKCMLSKMASVSNLINKVDLEIAVCLQIFTAFMRNHWN